jgi:septum formation protein
VHRIYLASASPRRAEILKQIGLDFTVVTADIVENLTGNPAPEALAASLASRKVEAIASGVPAGIVIGADTIVVCDGKVMGKPSSREEAEGMLRFLSGRCHKVITGLAVLNVSGNAVVDRRVDVESTLVYFHQLEEREIKAYLRTGEPMDKAGAYGIQGKGALLVRRIEGCYFNVVGLPVGLLARLLKELGVRVLG